jgi:hypothetical protein
LTFKTKTARLWKAIPEQPSMLDSICKKFNCTLAEYFALQNVYMFQLPLFTIRKPCQCTLAPVIAPWNRTNMPPPPSKLLAVKALIDHPESTMRGLASVKTAKNPLLEAMRLGAALTEMLR